MTKAKICGITNLQDLEAVTGLGANAIGVVTGIPSSPRNVSLEMAKTLIDEIPVFTKSVLVLASRNLDEAIKIVKYLRPDAIQIYAENIDIKELSFAIQEIDIIKPVSANNSDAKRLALNETDFCDAILLDSNTSTKLGGTGETHDWEISRKIAEAIKPVPLILAGGLNPDNVDEAIRRVRPYAVDVCTGTEARPGVKDLEKVKSFLDAVVEANRRYRA
jgi:phosphoribosylanthranilate isomerase